MGYHLAGHEVFGVDIKPQPDYPFAFQQADAVTYPLEGFDIIHASPPCQRFTRARHVKEAQGHPDNTVDLLTPMLRRLQASDVKFIVENVPGSPMTSDVMLCGSMFDLRVRRHRNFMTNIVFPEPPLCNHKKQGKPVGVYHRMGDTVQGKSTKTGKWVVGGSTAKNIEEAREAMGIDWMKWPQLKESIPPAYTKWLGEHMNGVT